MVNVNQDEEQLWELCGKVESVMTLESGRVCVMSCVMFCFFHALLCLLSFKSFLWSALCLPLSVSLVPSWSVPLCSSPSLSHLASSLLALLRCSSFGNQCLCT